MCNYHQNQFSNIFITLLVKQTHAWSFSIFLQINSLGDNLPVFSLYGTVSWTAMECDILSLAYFSSYVAIGVFISLKCQITLHCLPMPLLFYFSLVVGLLAARNSAHLKTQYTVAVGPWTLFLCEGSSVLSNCGLAVCSFSYL